LSAGLSLQDLRVIGANVEGLTATSARKRLTPAKLLPRPQGETPVVYGVAPAYAELAGLRAASGRFFDVTDDEAAAAVAVLGQAAAVALFGADDPVGRFVKVNEQWFRVIGVAGPQLAVQTDLAGLPALDRNNIIYVPLMASLLRLEDAQSWQKDEIDGIYLNLAAGADVNATGALVRGMLDTLHRGAGDFTVVVPAELLAEQQRTRRLFEVVMVAIASISLLVGGIGIMNIMLASVLERTREIGVRRAVGARRRDIVRQFLVETTLITTTGGALGVLFGVGLSQLVGRFAGWSTIITPGSVVLAFAVSVSVGLIFGVYPALRAARLDPVQALHYE
jgi:putative ABC transport system permease protein